MRLGETFLLRLQRGALAAAMLIVAMPPAMAQPGVNTGKAAAPNALQGFSQNRGQPVQIEAAHLEVRDKDKVATFSGNVKVVQGDTTMRCKSLMVFYEQSGGDHASQDNLAATKAAQPGFGGSSQIKKLEARGGVTVVQKDQTASGETGLFDMKSNTVTLIGHVIVSQGQNVIRGERVVVDLTTGVSHVESGSGPVRVLIQQQPQTPGAPGSSGPPHRFGPQRSSSK
jgi:lipopolysaccharide export system protein LptA